MELINLVVQEFREWTEAQGLGRARAEIRVENLGIPHRPLPLLAGWQGVYCFRYGAAWLKVGKAGPKSAARWTSQHYNAGSAPSTLAFSLLRYGHFSELEFSDVPELKEHLQDVKADELGDWIKKYTERVNVIIRAEIGPSGLDMLEKIAHGHLKPRFEGNWDPDWRRILMGVEDW